MLRQSFYWLSSWTELFWCVLLNGRCSFYGTRLCFPVYIFLTPGVTCPCWKFPHLNHCAVTKKTVDYLNSPRICQLFSFSRVGQRLSQQIAPAAAGGGALVPVLCTFQQKRAPMWFRSLTSNISCWKCSPKQHKHVLLLRLELRKSRQSRI